MSEAEQEERFVLSQSVGTTTQDNFDECIWHTIISNPDVQHKLYHWQQKHDGSTVSGKLKKGDLGLSEK